MPSGKTLTFEPDPIDSVNLGLELESLSNEPLEIIKEKRRGPRNEEKPGLSPAPAFRERRKWKRFAVEGAVVMVEKPSRLPVLKPSQIILGPVKDISMKGLAVHYVEHDEQLFKKINRLSIMFIGKKIIADRIPFKIVSSFKAGMLPGGKEVWNLCISFTRLIPMQKIQLENFINDYGSEIKNTWSGKPAAATK